VACELITVRRLASFARCDLDQDGTSARLSGWPGQARP
jgi:hypothetical protein